MDGVEPIVRDGLIELVRCRRINITGTQVLDSTPNGIYLEDCADTLINGCTILDDREPKRMQVAVRWLGAGSGNVIANSRIGKGTETDMICPDHVQRYNNR